jgi:hypothetical protein
VSHRPDDPFSGRLYRSSVYPEDTVTDPTTDVPVERPNPLRGVANSVGVAYAALSGVIGAAAAFGGLSAAQATALNDIGAALPGWIMALGTILGAVIPAAGAVAASFHTARAGEHKVTPLSSPVDVDGRRLVPVGEPLAATHLNVHERGER